jgi:catechol 2,3-dioxygenase-like lactoylglutathione lyase family enzyme
MISSETRPCGGFCFLGEVGGMESDAIVGIDHVQITVPKGGEAAARAFYCGIMGLVEIEKPEALRARGGFWLQVGDPQVHVGIEEGVDRKATKAHIAYQVTDLAKWRDRLEKAGVTIRDSVPIPGFDRFEFRDPFGNRVELIQPW